MKYPTISAAACLLAAGLAAGTARAVDPAVLAAEKERIAAIEKVKPAVVAVFAQGGNNGGSGVIIDKDGFALTNFHVVQATGPVMKCGLPDGILYDAVLVGLDKVGDVALIQLLPKKEGTPFPFVQMADSDKVKAGDWSLAMGNPFLLATDFTPTVTYGLVSGVNRYQYPSGSLLEYTDCIQIDTSINPGNSGGPLFNMKGELIGINGRGSFEKRGRVNSGVGYAISINQIKNFLGHLYAGIDTDHASLGAVVETTNDDLGLLTVKDVIPESDVGRRGLEIGDELVAFAGRPMTSVNQFKNVLGIYPKDWRMPLVYRRDNVRKESLVRLMGVLDTPKEEKPAPGGPGKPPTPPIPDTPAKKLYKPLKGFANYHFNEVAQNRLLAGFRKQGDFSAVEGDWTFIGSASLAKDKAGKARDFSLVVGDQKDGEALTPVVKMNFDGLNFAVEPLKSVKIDEIETILTPPDSGGLMLAMHHLKRMLTLGPKGFDKDAFTHGGVEPFYVVPPGQPTTDNLKRFRVDTEVIRTEYAAVPGKWYFDPKEHKLLGFEIYPVKDGDPCEVYLSDYKAVDGRQVPHRIEVRRGFELYGVFTVGKATLAAAK
jgi:S1-C subfamily serine protease